MQCSQVESGSALIQVLTCPSAHASEAAASGINGSAEDQGCILLGDMFGSESVEGVIHFVVDSVHMYMYQNQNLYV